MALTETIPTAADNRGVPARDRLGKDHLHSPARRPVLRIDDLDCRPEWGSGRSALLAFFAECPECSRRLGAGGEQACWRHAGVEISVELVYGSPVVALRVDARGAVLRLTDADVDWLRAQCNLLSGLDGGDGSVLAAGRPA